jgi:hypothetical protein
MKNDITDVGIDAHKKTAPAGHVIHNRPVERSDKGEKEVSFGHGGRCGSPRR